MNAIAAVHAAVSAAGGEGGEEMPSVLAVPIDELIIGIIAFLIVFGALAKLALPNIKRTLDERADVIEGGIKRAEEAQSEAQRVLEEYKAQLAEAREEAAGIRTQAQATSQLTRQVGELAVTLAGKVVGTALSDDARVRQTVDDFLADLERQAAR